MDRSFARFGLWSAIGTAITTTITFTIAILTPPLSGQFCREGCFRYPYLDVASRFPRDYYWMFLACVAILFFVAFALGLANRDRHRSRPLPRMGVVLAGMAAVTLLGDYYVQLSVIQPSLRAGESDGVALLTQYNPHGLFIALEEMGYLLTSLALACLIPALSTTSRLERAVRLLFLAGLIANACALAFFVLWYAHGRGYLFEIAVISIDWLVLIAASCLMTFVYWRELAARDGAPVGPNVGDREFDAR